MKDAGQQTATTDILHARGLIARSGVSYAPHGRRADFHAAKTLLKSQLELAPDDINVRFELVQTLSEVNIRGQRSSVRLAEASARLEETLVEITTLRNTSPDNTLFLVTEVHLRHKLSAVVRTQSRYDDAELLLDEAIHLQTTLMQMWPDSLRHRCWRAMLYRSQAMMHQERQKPDAAQEAITKARADVDAIDAEHSDHPIG